MPFDMGSINTALSSTVGSIEGKLQSDMSATQGGDLSQGQMIQLQYELNKWQMVTSLQSNIMKTLSDGVKGTIQNMR